MDVTSQGGAGRKEAPAKGHLMRRLRAELLLTGTRVHVLQKEVCGVDADISASNLFDQFVRYTALNKDVEQLRALDQNCRIGIANGRVLEAPDGISAGVRIQD